MATARDHLRRAFEETTAAGVSPSLAAAMICSKLLYFAHGSDLDHILIARPASTHTPAGHGGSQMGSSPVADNGAPLPALSALPNDTDKSPESPGSPTAIIAERRSTVALARRSPLMRTRPPPARLTGSSDQGPHWTTTLDLLGDEPVEHMEER
ncbi:hypothetical protein BU24DRAFT_456398 [Aaosphaeria arxii CBS 175.79]|uniref:Uncharacterized protein n=1 Tax=Aaosphaeria arxii CBS 175.79 TaxID=1450172 RepID=A0A6A5X5S3_9PLEO|nr:uncharacterized protein BU24DRAFT_456398 [Aaosphaeria arxii CBS 175.79]KAF2008303.1 hypothetical protein BU24DRAFT_456398 [Aaosphaeria arxii CBS 175.79]